jgi:hypothetical protein
VNDCDGDSRRFAKRMPEVNRGPRVPIVERFEWGDGRVGTTADAVTASLIVTRFVTLELNDEYAAELWHHQIPFVLCVRKSNIEATMFNAVQRSRRRRAYPPVAMPTKSSTSRDQDIHKGAKEDDRAGPVGADAPGLDKNGMPDDATKIAQDAEGARVDKSEG